MIGDPHEPGIGEAERRHRDAPVSGAADLCGVDPCAVADAARRPDVVVAVRRSGLARA